jgi:feruloyl esterase
MLILCLELFRTLDSRMCRTHLQPWGLRMASHVQPVNGSSWLDTSHWAAVHAEVMRQCDAIDGVVDNIIGNPQRCQFRPETLACRPSTNTSTVCLNSAQIGALKKIYSPWVDVNQTCAC